jgi:lipoyl(octanoyl) transferase
VELQTGWLGRTGYREAWERQHELVAARAEGRIPDQLLLVEHDPVLTLGRHASAAHVRASRELLAMRGIELIRVERGGEVTYHGPGQLVAYPIVHLAARGLLLRPLVRALESAMVDTAASYGLRAARRDGFPGCWCDGPGAPPRKLGALGLRIERGVSYHGIALNVTTSLVDFELIDPCGMPDIEVTSIAREAGWAGEAGRPSTHSVAEAAVRFEEAFRERLDEASDLSGGPRARRNEVTAGAA